MADNEKKPVLPLLPAILTGSAALIASLTAVYVNLRGDRAPAAPAAAQPAQASSVVRAAPSPAALRLRLDRIAVQHDGSLIGTTDWRFAVEVDGQPLFVFSQPDLDDAGGRNVVSPRDAGGMVALAPGARARVVVKAWRDRRLSLREGPPDAQGEGSLAGPGAMAPLMVSAADPGKGEMTLYFGAASQ